METNDRIAALAVAARKKRLDCALVGVPADIFALTGLDCENAILEVRPGSAGAKPEAILHTDFRFAPMVRRTAPQLECRNIKRFRPKGRRIGFESSIPHSRYLSLAKKAPDAKFVDVVKDVAAIRAVKTPDEIAKIRRAEAVACGVWEDASSLFEPGMTERDMARIVRRLFAERADGEAFSTIVCVGKNAAECHHEPDDTVWNGREPVLVDLGARLDGVCSDLTRNLVNRASRLYRQVFALVREANRAAIAAARPGMSGKALDAVARDVIKKGGFGKCFGHSLGHGVGREIHEKPYASERSVDVLRPGMLVTIEPGVYLESNLGVRIEDLILITETGCEVLSPTPASRVSPLLRRTKRA